MPLRLQVRWCNAAARCQVHRAVQRRKLALQFWEPGRSNHSLRSPHGSITPAKKAKTAPPSHIKTPCNMRQLYPQCSHPKYPPPPPPPRGNKPKSPNHAAAGMASRGGSMRSAAELARRFLRPPFGGAFGPLPLFSSRSRFISAFRSFSSSSPACRRDVFPAMSSQSNWIAESSFTLAQLSNSETSFSFLPLERTWLQRAFRTAGSERFFSGEPA